MPKIRAILYFIRLNYLSHMQAFENPITAQIARFLNETGIPVKAGVVAADAFLPGIAISPDGLVVDESSLLYPGDLLHEAGHLAVAAPADRFTMNSHVGDDAAQEMMAIAWSYAASVHLEIDPVVVFHPQGYKGQSASILAAFQSGHGFGVPMLQYHGMCADTQRAKALDIPAYPAMLVWLRPRD
jgi:hypothetical protein